VLYADLLDNAKISLPISAVQDRWLSVDELAGYLGVKRDTVYKWITRRSMPAHKVGRLWKFRKEEIDTWVRSGAASDSDK
jgi:excisionase family DNA binding protein